MGGAKLSSYRVAENRRPSLSMLMTQPFVVSLSNYERLNY